MDSSTPNEDNTSQLLDESIGGSEVAMDKLVERHLPALRVYVQLQVGDALRQQESCSDVVQSVCRELIAGLDKFEYQGEGQFRSWLYTAALNKIRQHERYHRAERRDIARSRPLPEHDDAMSAAFMSVFTPSQGAIARETSERIEAAFDLLPPNYREVLTMSRVLGLPRAEIAQRTGKTLASVRNLLNRAMVRFAALVDE